MTVSLEYWPFKAPFGLLPRYFYFWGKNGKNSIETGNNRPEIDLREVKESKIERNDVP
jgi:hypothetical protein